MLQITVPAKQIYDERTQTFIYTKEQTLTLEHSLVSLSKWESRWCKPFLTEYDKTSEETIDYIKCMTLTQNVDPYVYTAIDNNIVRQVQSYIDAPMTATWFNDTKTNKRNSEQLTNELLYYYMFSLGINMKCEKWHLNRLITLIRVYEAKSQKPKPMTPEEQAALNAARRKKLNSKG